MGGFNFFSMPEDKIDYKELLKKYIKLVHNSNFGDDLISSRYFNEVDFIFSKEEFEKLLELAYDAQ